MSLEDEVNAERARARAAAIDHRRADFGAERERDAGRARLLELVAEAHRILRDRGGRRAVQARVEWRQSFWNSKKDRFSWSLGELAFTLGINSGFVITEDGRIVVGHPLPSPKGPGIPQIRSAVQVRRQEGIDDWFRAFQHQHSEAELMIFGADIDWSMTPPDSYTNKFYFHGGTLSYGSNSDNGVLLGKPADRVFAQWVAESLDGS
ncbi:hypothetical protein [Curtobacterium sp. MCSS17_016]|uniref:hypothetical protein n=1 Tax=Curtobacterium sp. MCSS17_016 TaxID=2175644 RepID=UPI0011B7B376|nr:hypothetical protein [Curtobacterium sp. MCSS17_016]WIE80929.1 hypothetical protein DEJ19_020650 [Curtobacterium sp. MCSS17_016]